MGMTKTAEALLTDIIEIAARGGWTRIASLPQAGTPELEEALRILHTDEVLDVEPEPFGFRITAADRASEIMIGGEARHLIQMR